MRIFLHATLLLLSLISADSIAQNYNMGNSTISACSGNFYDSGGNGNGAGANYRDNENYTMTFCSSTPGQCVRLTFTRFNTESNYDFLRIYNGSSTAAPLLGTFSGTANPGTFTATSGCLTLRFSSDGSFNYSGWAATISCVPCPSSPCGSTCSGGPAPSNDACSGARNLGLLPVPAACPSGIGTPQVTNTTNLCATAETPYTSLLGCQPNGNMASPAADVWYQFSITGPTLNININGLQAPNIGLYSGSNCSNLVPRGCAIGGGGSLNTSFGGLAPGTYWLQVSGGNLNDQCNFSLQLQNNFDCAGCVIVSNLTVNPPPVNGTYQAGQQVNFCYTISDYNQTSVNWLHSVIPSFSAGWDLSTLTTTMPANCSGVGIWTWNNGLVTSSATGLVVGPGFFYESAAGSPGGVRDANPGNNFGDNNSLNACDWTFCFSIRTLPPGQCIPGLPLNVSIDTYGDGETGSWTSFACSGDPITQFFAQMACCAPPVVNNLQPACAGGTGSAIATGQGVAPWNYVWRNNSGTVLQSANNVNGSNTLSNLAPGTYSVTVTDDAGCTSTTNFTISNPVPIALTGAVTNLSCSGVNNGSILVSPSGGTGPYTYVWSPNVGVTSNPTGLAAGTYTVTVTDASGCTSSQTFSVTQAPAVTASIAPTAVSCFNGTNGSATVTASGGTGPYTYSWSPTGGVGATANGLIPGSYSVTVTDSRGCTIVVSTTITQPSQVIAQINNSTNVTCNGGTNGSATVAGSGGTPAYTYAWAPSGGNGATGTGMAAGNYTVTITDSRGCTSTANITITQPTAITATLQNVTNVTCNGAADGSASVNASGGNPAYNFSWSPSGGNSSTASGLPAGNYTVTVTDASGCTRTVATNITQPAPVTATVSPVPVRCNGAFNGSVSATAGGGTGPYSYNWLPSGGAGASATGLGAGTYTVTVTDANGCTRSASASINEPSAITYTTNTTPAACGVADGSATVTPSGGIGPYSYSWAPTGGNGATASNIPAGAYNVTITDANGCTITAAVGVSNTNSATVNINASTDVSCNGGSDGTAAASVSGGSAPFTYAWSPAGGSGATAGGLQAGNYTVTVTDINGCSATANIAINEPPLLTAAISAFADVVCAGDATGTATVLANGGSPGYSYAWSPAGGGGVTAANLPGGNYTVTVTDALGCTSTTNVTINEPTPVTAAVTPTNITCNGATNGSANVIPGGGNAPYSFSWSPTGGSGSSANGLTAGTYTVTVTDASGCTASATANIAEPAPLTASVTSANVSCFGANNGSINASINGGTAPLSYSWSPSGGNGASAAGLGQGSYTVTVTDASGCTVSATAAITEPAQINVLITNSTSLLCNGDSNGSASASANGGAGTLTYSWSPTGGSTNTAGGLAAGTYTVTVTDGSGCTNTAAVAINEPPLLTSAIIASNNLLCNGSADGSATVAANGGTAPYSYSWSPSVGVGTTVTGLSGGSYSVTITDGNGCTSTSNITITEPPPIQVSISGADATCGLLNGTASASVNGGTPGYSYNWTPSGGTNSNASGLDAGIYTIEVTDLNGCIQRANITLTNSLPPVTSSAVTSNVDCFGGNNGAASVSISQGTAPISYSWSPSGGSGSSATNLSAGFYTVTVTDALGCTAIENITISEPAELTLSGSGGAVTCGGIPTGYAAVDAAGGVPGYSYAWSPGGATADSLASLAGGNYTVVVTDAVGCTTSTSIVVAEPPVLTATSTSTNITCYGAANGTVTIAGSGGTGAYTYAWSPSGGTLSTATGLSAGAYAVTITDANGCTASATALINEPAALTLNVTNAADVSCFNNANGSATVTPTGGTPAYSFAWSPSGGTGSSANGLAAGSYTVTVTDISGCTAQVPITISQPTQLSVQASSDNLRCNGSADGSINAIVSGGSGPYDYSWTPGSAATAGVNNVSAGNYTVTITDANGCVSTASTIVTEPPLLVVSANPTAVSCNGGSDGSVVAVANGGTTTYSYSWFPSGGTNTSAAGLTAATYSVTVTDANGCTTSATAAVTEPAAMLLTVSTTPSSCGGTNGSANLSVSGGIGPYVYSWTPSGGSGSSISNVAAGAYAVVVTDANGCTQSTIANVVNTGGPTVSASVIQQVSCANGSDGQASANVSSGTAPYTYAWSPAGGNGITAATLQAGNYSVTVTDANGCISSDNVTITEPGSIVAQTTQTATLCAGSADGSLSVNATGGTGSYSFSWTPGGATGATANGLSAGSYIVIITDANGCTASASGNVTSPAAVSATATSTATSCHGGADGGASANASGGTPGYTYSWFPSGTSGSATNGLSAGAYTVTVTDANGCIASASTIVTEPAAINLTTSSTPSGCGTSDGSATVNVNGGSGPYTYLWSSGGSTGSTANNLPAGSYTVTVTDANGCSNSTSVVVSTLGGPTVTLATLTDVTCHGMSDGSASIQVNGGTGPFTYLWTPTGGNGTSASGLSGGNYVVSVSDASGCLNFVNLLIQEPDAILLQTTSTPTSCGSANGSAGVMAAGGSGNYSYAWSPGSGTTANLTNISSGNYSVIVTDGSGCSQSAAVVVSSIGGATATIQSLSDVSCNGGNNGSATIFATGGTAPYSYLWSPYGGTSVAASGLTAGTYQVQISDSTGCVSTVQVLITEPDGILIQTSATPAACNGGTDGSASAIPSGGNPPYQYQWIPGSAATAVATGLTAGLYTVVVTDASGCPESAQVVVNSNTSMVLTPSSTDVNCHGMSNGTASVNVVGGSAPYSYSWSPAVGNGSTATGLSGGDYTLTVTDAAGCANLHQFEIAEPAPLIATLPADQALCPGLNLALTASVSGGTQPYSYLWTNGSTDSSQTVTPVGTQQYGVTVTDINGCSSGPLSVTISLPDPLIVDATGDGILCSGTSATIGSEISGGAGEFFYSWNNGAITTPGSTVFPSQDSTFTVTVTDGCGNTASDVVTILVRPGPTVAFTPQLIEGCSPVVVNFLDGSIAPAGSSYSWNLGDGSTSNEVSPTHIYTSPGSYNVDLMIETPDGCTGNLNISNLVTVLPFPQAGFSASEDTVDELNANITFENTSNGATWYAWDFGDGSPIENGFSVTHNYADTGTYEVRLIVANEAGCLDTIYGIIRVEEQFAIYIPNAFSPNNDDVNESFIPLGVGWTDFEMWIMDRWGLVIMHSTDPQIPWNGSYQNNQQPCQQDVYEYIVSVRDVRGKGHRLVGHVTLVR